MKGPKRSAGTTKTTVKRVLIANRGEIAFRISKTLNKMKIQTVGLCIPAERTAAFLSLCDQVHVFQRNDMSNFLDIENIIQIAKNHKVDAIHPGYGFLSENPRFAQACKDSGITFIGPEAKTIELMGNKHQAKEFAKSCGVAVLETIVESHQNDSSFEKNVRKLPLPIILKPLNGGGGKGMVILRNFMDLKKSIEEARNIALKAFGDSSLLAEPLIENALHLEIQVIGDRFGNVQHLFERDCTIQRRHQKIVEETPSPIVEKNKLELIYLDAMKIAKQSKYQSLGTVEFILDQNHNHYFMEMNTRLQVEHPVTEITLGLDLVEKQIQIAQDEMLEKILPKKLKQNGHAIEVRVYTENPQANFLPSTGRIEYLKTPKESSSLRIDCGIEAGNHIHHSFDPMILKITAHGKTREKAIETLSKALQNTVVLGVHTNINYLQWVLNHEDFIQAKHDTSWTAHTLEVFQNLANQEETLQAIIQSYEKEKMRQQSDWRNDPWLTVDISDQQITWEKNRFTIDAGGSKIEGVTTDSAHGYWIYVHGNTYNVPKKEIDFEHDVQESSKLVRAPMTGTIVNVLTKEGASVKKKDVLIEMEAMKMQYKIEAQADGTIAKLNCQPKDIVDQDSILIELQ